MELTKEILKEIRELYSYNGYSTRQKNKIHYQTVCFDSSNYIGVYKITNLETNFFCHVQIDNTLDDITGEHLIHIL